MAVSILSGQKKVKDTTEDEKSGASSPTIQAVGGGESAFTTATPTSATKTTKPSPIKGSGYTNIQKIMAASGAGAGPTRLAGTVAGGIGATTAGAAGAFKAAKEEYGSKVETAGQEVGSRLSKGQSIISGASKGETPDVQTFGTLTSGTYQAPEFQMSPEARRRTAEASALAQLAGQAGGRGAILQRYVRAPQYNVAQQRMDELLLGKGGSAAIRGALRQGAKLEADVGRQEAVAKEQAKQLQAQATGIAEQLKTQLGGEVEKFKGILDTTKTTELDRMTNAAQRVYDAIRTAGVTEDRAANVSKKDLKILGLTEDDFKNIINYGNISNLEKFMAGGSLSSTKEQLSSALSGMGAASFASPEQLAILSALGKLSGEGNLGYTNLGEGLQYAPSESYLNLGSYSSDLIKSVNTNITNIKTKVQKLEDELENLHVTGLGADERKTDLTIGNRFDVKKTLDTIQNYYLNSNKNLKSTQNFVDNLIVSTLGVPVKINPVSGEASVVNPEQLEKIQELRERFISDSLSRMFRLRELDDMQDRLSSKKQFTFID